MEYSTKFNASWAKPKKPRAKKESQAAVTVAAVEPSREVKGLENSTKNIAEISSKSASTTIKSEPEQTKERERLPCENTASLAAAGIRTIDFAFVSRDGLKLTNTPRQNDAQVSSNQAVQDQNQTPTSTGEQQTQHPRPLRNPERASQYASSFSPLWSQPTLDRRGAMPDLNTNDNQHPPALYAQRSVVSPRKVERYERECSPPRNVYSGLRHSDRYRIIREDDLETADTVTKTSLDSGTVRLLKEKFSAAEFLEYYRADRPVVDAGTLRAGRGSGSSIGDTPPKYQRASRWSNNSQSGANSRANSSHLR